MTPTPQDPGDASSRLLLAVLDTSCVRTGLYYRLRNGALPVSVTQHARYVGGLP
jgi:hypothetical protein